MAREFEGCWQSVDISGAGIAGLVLSFMSILFYAISVGTDHWGEDKAGPLKSFDTNLGLWQYCGNQCEKYVDNQFEGQPSDLNLVTRTEACAAFVVLAIFLTLCSAVMVVFGMGREGFGGTVTNASLNLVGAAFFGMVSMAIFADIIRELPGSFTPGYSFALVTVAWVFNMVAALLVHIDSRNISYLRVEAARKGGAGMI
eukprot:m.117580 g.117580  ORF g.117580 m.117580 type:complete len:200 (+) comp16402_c4_seq1:1769-2368(+)